MIGGSPRRLVANRVVQQVAVHSDAVTNGAAAAFRQSLANLRAVGVVLHGLRIGLRVGEDLAVSGNDRDARAAGGDLRNPVVKFGGVFGLGRRQKWEGGSAGLRDSGDGGKLGVGGAFVIAAQSAFREVIYRQQSADQQRQKC